MLASGQEKVGFWERPGLQEGHKKVGQVEARRAKAGAGLRWVGNTRIKGKGLGAGQGGMRTKQRLGVEGVAWQQRDSGDWAAVC